MGYERRCANPRFACLMVLLAGSATAYAGEPAVTISGGADPTGHQYTWTVTNKHFSEIVRIAFPHYRADLFFAPKGWRTDESTFIVNVGVPDRPGVCVARAKSPGAGLRPDASATFRMQIAAAGAQRRRGTVLVRFADGTEAHVPDVELPQRAQASERYITLIALGSVVVVWLAVRSLRRRKPA